MRISPGSKRSAAAASRLRQHNLNDAMFDVTPDPNRFLVGRVQRERNPIGITFVTITNWFDDFRRRAPVNR